MNRLHRIAPYKTVPILIYHQIATTTIEEDPLRLAIPVHRFDAQMKYLYKRGFVTLNLAESFGVMDSSENNCGRRIIITFDDGYLDNYTNAFPILQKYAFSSTIFVVSSLIGKKKSWGLGSSPPLMEWDHIKEMLKYGFCFQSHTATHPDLTALADELVLEELVKSKKNIEDTLGLPVMYMSYPFGRYNKRVMKLVKKAGYAAAYGVGSSVCNSKLGNFCKERFQIDLTDSSLQFRLKTSVWGAWMRKTWNLR